MGGNVGFGANGSGLTCTISPRRSWAAGDGSKPLSRMGQRTGRGEVVHGKGTARGSRFHSLSSLSRCRIVAASGDEVCTDPKKPWVKKAMKKLQRKK